MRTVISKTLRDLSIFKSTQCLAYYCRCDGFYTISIHSYHETGREKLREIKGLENVAHTSFKIVKKCKTYVFEIGTYIQLIKVVINAQVFTKSKGRAPLTAKSHLKSTTHNACIHCRFNSPIWKILHILLDCARGSFECLLHYT